MTLYILCTMLALMVLWVAHGVRQIGKISKGEPIGKREKTAVILIDLQTVFWNDSKYDATLKAQVLETIQQEVLRAKSQGDPIIAVQQEWSQSATKMVAKLTMKGQAIAGSPGTEIAAPFVGMADHTLVKRVQDAFETGALDKLLADLDVGQLRVMGLDGLYCVARTAKAALGRGIKVTLVKKGILTSDSDKLTTVMQDLRDEGAQII